MYKYNKVHFIIGITLFFALIGFLSNNVSAQSSNIGYTTWSYPVAVQKDANPEVISLAKKTSDMLGTQSPLLAKTNPVCCLWLEVTDWKPEPGSHGYIVVIQEGGGIVRASNVEQLDLAIDQLGKLLKRVNGEVLLPVGLSTNYKLMSNKSVRSIIKNTH